MTLLAWCVAWILDVVIGDPPHWPHPVRWIGRLIAVSQRVVRRVCHSDRALRIGGGVMWLVVIGLTWGVARGVLALAHGIHPRLGWLVEVWMIFTALAGRCLAQSAMAVARPLQAGDLAESRHKLSGLSGAIPLSSSQRRSTVRWWRPWRRTRWMALSRRSFSCSSAARRWPWPIKRSTPSIPWSAINTKNTGRSAWSALVLMM